jgi:hypothetical protein
MKTWKPSRFLVTTNSMMDSMISGRGRNRGAGRSEVRNQHDAEGEIDGEGAGIDHRADALLAQHVEQPLDRTDRRACQQAGCQDEHQVIAVGELGAEQREDRPAEGEQQRGCRQRRPKRPLDRFRQERRQRRAVAGDVIGAEAVRRRRRDRVVDERHQRQRLGGRVDGDVVGAGNTQHQHVGVGQRE